MLLIPVLVNVAFITLLERKILGYRQNRVGPAKVSILGFMQPIADAVKLFCNQIESPFSRNYILYFLSPILGICLILLI